jgi:hypothetical protein
MSAFLSLAMCFLPGNTNGRPHMEEKVRELLWSGHLCRWPSCLLVDPNFPQQQPKVNWGFAHHHTNILIHTVKCCATLLVYTKNLERVICCCTTRTSDLHKTSNQSIQCQRISTTASGVHIVESCMDQFRRSEVFTPLNLRPVAYAFRTDSCWVHKRCVSQHIVRNSLPLLTVLY